jgi:glycosyltransferase involved in cell wall biosynthesis
MYNQINNYLTHDPQDINDILIIDGSSEDDKISPDLAFYHTIGLAEYLSANRIYSKVIKQNDLKIEHLKLFRGFIFYQVCITNGIRKFINKANYFNKKIFLAEYTGSQSLIGLDEDDLTNFKHINLNTENLFIPDIALKNLNKSKKEIKNIDYLFLFNSSTNSEFITKQLEHNYVQIKHSKVKIITHINSKFQLSLSSKLNSLVEVEVYRDIEEKIAFIQDSKVVVINNDSELETDLNEIECQISSVDYIKDSNPIDFDKHKPISSFDKDKLIQKYSAIYSRSTLFNDIRTNLTENIVFNVAGTVVRGGINVIVKHANVLRASGKDVTLLSDSTDETNIKNSDGELNVLSKQKRYLKQNIDKLIATLWTTCFFVESYPDAKRKMYLVQGFETDFSSIGDSWRILANNTYRYNFEYLTISKWCVNWLRDQYQHAARYCPNGLNTNMFTYKSRDFDSKIRVLIEGSNIDEFRNIDESFKITNQLDPKKFEVWYLTYDGEPKSWYRLDKFLHKIPYEEVAKIYQSCHILVKSSKLESFSYPPLEMMATGGIAVVALNNGNAEYVEHEKNCMVYNSGDIEKAKFYIEQIVKDEKLRSRLIFGGKALVKSRSWENITKDILNLYN